MKKIAQMGHDGMARVINPVHTPWDGDTLFSMSTGTSRVTVDAGRLGTIAAEVVSQAILCAVEAATSFADFADYPSLQDLRSTS
jgi:L-aminopeptidase/D-esterase-like protein